MLVKKFWIPVVLVLIGVAIGGTFWRQHIASQEPIKVYKSVELDRKAELRKAAEPPDISEQEHFYADSTWHADADETSEIPVSDAEVSLSEVLERFPQYEILSPKSQREAREIVRKDKILAKLEARAAELERKLAEREAQKQLVSYLESEKARLNTEYPDVIALGAKYPNFEIEDLIREYPDASERHQFMERALEAGLIIREMVDRVLATPGIRELPSEKLEPLLRYSSSSAVIEEAMRQLGGLDP